jgi:phage terminase Nu1 subunit (DNA packaging protein)
LLVTFAELAAIKGCTKAAVTHASKSRIAGAVVVKDGKKWLDRDLALELWNKNTAATPLSKVSKPDPVEPAPKDAKELRRRVDALPDDSIPELNESRARREHYQAELAKLQVTQQRGELVPVDHVKKEAFALGRSVREALANLADRLSHQLAGETDPARIHKVLSDEHRAALVELADG